MKKLILLLFIASSFICCDTEPQPNIYANGEIMVDKMTEPTDFLLGAPKTSTPTACTLEINGSVKEDIGMELYDSTGTRLITKRIIPKGTYRYPNTESYRDFRVDYYENQKPLLRLIPKEGSEESFTFKWIIG